MPDHDPLRPHRHEPNLLPPAGDGTFTLTLPDGRATSISRADLQRLPLAVVADCYIVSTGHGASGPFRFGGARLLDLVTAHLPDPTAWSQVEVVSADGFGNRIFAHELWHPDPAGPMVLAYQMDGVPLTRAQGLVRLIVPSERDDALRQVKWVGQVNARG